MHFSSRFLWEFTKHNVSCVLFSYTDNWVNSEAFLLWFSISIKCSHPWRAGTPSKAASMSNKKITQYRTWLWPSLCGLRELAWVVLNLQNQLDILGLIILPNFFLLNASQSGVDLFVHEVLIHSKCRTVNISNQVGTLDLNAHEPVSSEFNSDVMDEDCGAQRLSGNKDTETSVQGLIGPMKELSLRWQHWGFHT